jgi:hypothetical protein
MFTVDNFGGWDQIPSAFFADGGEFDRIQASLGDRKVLLWPQIPIKTIIRSLNHCIKHDYCSAHEIAPKTPHSLHLDRHLDIFNPDVVLADRGINHQSSEHHSS